MDENVMEARLPERTKLWTRWESNFSMSFTWLQHFFVESHNFIWTIGRPEGKVSHKLNPLPKAGGLRTWLMWMTLSSH